MRTALFILLAGLVCGCGKTDPCFGQPGVCVAATVEGTVTGLDQLRITTTLPSMETLTTPSTPKAFDLPVSVALEFPAGTSGSATFEVEGIGGGQLRASSGPVSFTFGGSNTVTITLVSGKSGDGGIGRDAGALGDGGGGDGGAGHRNWTNESVTPNPGDFRAVWGAAPDDVYASVGGSSCQIYHSTGNGSWTPYFTAASCTGSISSIWGSAANNIYAVGSYATLQSSGGGSWSAVPLSQNPPPGGNVVWGTGANDVYIAGSSSGVGTTPVISHFNGTSFAPELTPSPSPSAPSLMFNAVGGAASQIFAVGAEGSAGGVRYQRQDLMPGADWNRVESAASPLNGIWAGDATHVWEVGNGDQLNRIASDGMGHTSESGSLPHPGDLFGIGGRAVAGAYDIYVVGSIGIFHSTGDGQWTHVTLPSDLAGVSYHAVWVAADGEVFAVGDQGHIAHLGPPLLPQ